MNDISCAYRKRLDEAFQKDVDISEMYDILKLDELKQILSAYLKIDVKLINISVYKDPEVEGEVSAFNWRSKYQIKIDIPHYLAKVLYTEGIIGMIQTCKSYVGKENLHNIAALELKFNSPLYRLALGTAYLAFDVFDDEDFQWRVSLKYTFETKFIDDIPVHEFHPKE